jgi:uncharacterized protein YbjT (DUF2867 family)
MRLLVLGGTHHVGRAVVEAALARGDEVTTLTRGVSGPPAAGARALHADRTKPGELPAVLGGAVWDAVIDTWSGAPHAVGDAARLLASQAGHYCYVSSRPVYRWPIPPGADESAPVVEADPRSMDSDDYAAAKRGGEQAAVEAFGGRALLARAGLILGPYEITGRMPWWLRRIERGGDVLAPGPPDLALQYIDGRDLAAGCCMPRTTGLAVSSTRSASQARQPCAACSRPRRRPPARRPIWSGSRRTSSFSGFLLTASGPRVGALAGRAGLGSVHGARPPSGAVSLRFGPGPT